MGLAEIIETVEEINDLDERRRAAFRAELAALEDAGLEGGPENEDAPTDAGGDGAAFERTRGAIADQRDRLADLEALLAAEADEIDELVAETSFLTVEQAVEHREQSVEKLEAHNGHLRTYREAVAAALDAVEANLDALVAGEELPADPEPHLEAAQAAIAAHNDAVEELDTNLTILNAYLV